MSRNLKSQGAESSKPMVTIGLPCHNVADTVSDTLRSILAQDFTGWELIVVDDGSADGTSAIVHGFTDPRVKVVADGKNRGRCARLNQIATLAQGKYLARMDADDLMLAARLRKQVAFLQRRPDVDLLGGGLISIDASGREKGMQLAPECVTSAYRILKGEVLYHPTVMGTTEWFRTHPYIEGYVYSDDFALWAKYAGELTIANLQEPLIKYREHERFTYAKYRGRSLETLKALREFGPAWVTPVQLRCLILRRHLKNCVYRLFRYTGLWSQTYRLSRRNTGSNG